MAVLSMTITDAKVPQVLYLGKVLDDKEVVLVGLLPAICCFAWSCQVCKLVDIVLNSPQGLWVEGLL